MESLELRLAKTISHMGKIVLQRNIRKRWVKLYDYAPGNKRLKELLDRAPYASPALDQEGRQERRSSSLSWKINKERLPLYVSNLEQKLAKTDGEQYIDIITLTSTARKLLGYLITHEQSVTSNGTYTQNELCAGLGLSKPTLFQGLATLMNLGLITKSIPLRRKDSERRCGQACFAYCVDIAALVRCGVYTQILEYVQKTAVVDAKTYNPALAR